VEACPLSRVGEVEKVDGRGRERGREREVVREREVESFLWQRRGKDYEKIN